MDTLTIDVRGLPDDRVHELEQLIEKWKQGGWAGIKPAATKRRKVDPSEFPSFRTKLTGPLTRALAYEL